MTTYIGIDPGKKGGIAIIEVDGGATIDIDAIPMDDSALLAMLRYGQRGGSEVKACLERVHSMKGQGVASMFTFGAGYGKIQGMLLALQIPYQLVTPQTWKKEFGATSDKNTSVEVCQRLFPRVNLLATPRSRKPHDGMAEALLLAEYARRKM